MIHNALVVDDSRTARFMLAKILQRLGVVTATANSAEEALDYLAGEVPDAIFIDHVMPGIDGLHATQQIKSDPRFDNVPIVIFTAKEGDAYIAQAKAHGAYSVLTKPPSDDFVQELLDELAVVVATTTSPDLEEQPTPAEVAAAPGLAEEEVERLARRAVDDAFADTFEAKLTELVDTRIETLRAELATRHDDDSNRFDELAAQAREAFDRDGVAKGHAELNDALLEATVGRVDALQAAIDRAGQVAAENGEKTEALAVDVAGLAEQTDLAAALAPRVDDLDAHRVDMAERTDKLVEEYVERSSRRYAKAVAIHVRKDAATLANKLVEKHVTALRDDLVQAQVDAGRKAVPMLPTLLAVVALAAAAAALFLALR
jgi:CheY-like chemotaxis protein